MAGQLKVIFDNKFSLGGTVKLVIWRNATAREKAANAFLSTSDIEIYADAERLIYETPTHEEEEANNAIVVSELSFKMHDTFSEADLISYNGVIGAKLVPGNASIFSKDHDFSLFQLISEWDIDKRFATGTRTTPPSPVNVEYYLDGDLKFHGVLDQEATNYDDIPFGYVEELEDDKVNIYSFERSLNVVSIDKALWLLERTSVRDGFMAANGFTEQQVAPVALDTSPPESAVILDTWSAATFTDSNGDPLDNPYKYLTICDVGYESDTTNKRRAMAWLGFSISDLFKRTYDRAFGTWEGECERSTWEFMCASIEASAFDAADGNGYKTYFRTREQSHGATVHDGPANHHVTNKFSLLKMRDDDDELWLEAGWSADWVDFDEDKIRHDPYEYSGSTYDNAWELLTSFAMGLGYGARYYFENGIRQVQHLFRRPDPPLVSYPDPVEGGVKGNPFGQRVGGVKVKHRAPLGKFLPFRRTVTAGSYDNTPLNTTLIWNSDKSADLGEYAYDTHGTVLLAWNNEDLNYWDPSSTEVNTKPSDQEAVLPPDVLVNPVELETPFCLTTNFPQCMVFGGTGSGGDGIAKGYKNKMSPEFVYVPAGSVAEMALVNRYTKRGYASAMPGLILFAGTSADHGKTITDRANPLWDDADFFRACGKIRVLFPNGNRLTAYSAKSALAMSELPIVYGDGEELTIEFPGLTNFSNERGQTGYNACVPGFGMDILGGLFRIKRVRRVSSTGNTEVDVKRGTLELPAVLVNDPTRIERNHETGASTGKWLCLPELWVRGGGGDEHYKTFDSVH